MSVYLHFSGVLIGIQGAFLVFAAVIIVRRELEWRRNKPAAELGDDLGDVLREKFRDIDAELDQILRDGEGRG